jgi:hypothetical protein
MTKDEAIKILGRLNGPRRMVLSVDETDAITTVLTHIRDTDEMLAGRGVANATVLKLIRLALTGDMVGFERYARFAGEKSDSQIFRDAIDKYFRGDFGLEVFPMQVLKDEAAK